MKNIILLALVVLSLTSFNTKDSASFNIVGRWKGIDNKEIGYVVFQADGYAYFEMNGKKMGGKSFTENGKKASMKYKFDDSERLMKIDIIVQIVGEKTSNSLLGIGEKIDDNSFKMQMSYDNVRPKAFDKKETIVFKRQ
ncbi:hypothetical protein [Flavobacterium sp. N2820]|uniref:hypothetical protein n=1 Tax=Flavobacterium sp. N2820 TaxID=2986834 RepID=UPI00222586F9|nr:hypothetical protein [Flavobacterium sp. N2820]